MIDDFCYVWCGLCCVFGSVLFCCGIDVVVEGYCFVLNGDVNVIGFVCGMLFECCIDLFGYIGWYYVCFDL